MLRVRDLIAQFQSMDPDAWVVVEHTHEPRPRHGWAACPLGSATQGRHDGAREYAEFTPGTEGQGLPAVCLSIRLPDPQETR